MDWLYAAPLGAACLHIVEEFFLPGGFAEWDRRYRPAFAKSITPRLHVIVNALLLVISYDVWATRHRSIGPFVWLTVAALLFTNALWHLRGAWKTRSYSPGMVTGTLLYIPLTIYGYAHLIRTGAASISTAVLGFALGGSYLLSSRLMYRRRSQSAASSTK